ncbi:MAG: hypothetical protein LBN02_03295 [Oscillospiraceae bacterium]|nr:hypothetical protein [Oscillospiraceae bacterium]
MLNLTFSVADLPFSRRLSYISVTADGDCLRIHKQMRTYADGADKTHDFRLTPTVDGNPAPFGVTAIAGLLTVAAGAGKLEFTFDGADILRVRGHGCAFEHEDTDLFTVRQIADGEWAIWESSEPEPREFRPFDECVAETQRDFAEWYALYADVEPQYLDMKKRCVYMIWICEIGARGKLTEPAILYTKPTEQACFSWHQVYHAMAMRDPAAASRTLMNLFGCQDAFGELPDLADDRYINITATKPPFHGFGLVYLLERLDFTRAQLEHMYGGLSKLYTFWTTLRDTDNDGVPQYNHGCESGNDFSAAFKQGVPVETPDIIAYVALLAEGLGKIASRLGNAEESRDWQSKSDRLILALTTEFWTGERFIARLSGSHEPVVYDELEAYMPLMLGSRLPAAIVDRLARDLSDPTLYYTTHGLRAEPKNAAPAWIFGFGQVKILPGLYDAGQRELAVRLLRGFVDYGDTHTPAFLFVEPSADGVEVGGIAGFTELSALSAAMWLDCAAYLNEVGDLV